MNTVTSNPQPSKLFVSVLIPVFNDRERLKICLKALTKQTYPKHLYEVIAIDNGSEEDLKSVVNCFEGTSILYETTPGSYVARNKGILAAKGDILAFTDADCIPTKSWLENGAAKLQSVPNCGMVGGKIALFFQNSEKPTAVELYESIEMGFAQDKLLEEQNYVLTANLFTYKNVLKDVGLFERNLKSGGDREWGQRVFKAGYKQAYAPKACVYHPARYTFKDLYKRVTRIDGGHYDSIKDKLSLKDRIRYLTKDLILAFTPPFRSLFKIWFNDNSLTTYKQKSQFILVMLFVRYISAWERIRLKMGGKSRRW